MNLKNGLAHYVTDAAANPKIVTGVSTAAIGTGASTYFELFTKGIGLAASTAGFLLAVMMIRKVMLENAKLKLEIQELERE